MKKDAYYFPHYSNARNDSKLVKLRRVMDIEGYGMYFMLLEVLREQTEFKLPLNIIEDLAYEWHTSKEKLIAVVTKFDLFTIEDDLFFSIKQITYLQPYIERSKRARDAANERWNNAKAYANALPEHSVSNTSKGEESKVKESKVNKQKRVLVIPFVTKKFSDKWELWKDYREELKKPPYKIIGEQSALTELCNLADGNQETAISIMQQSMNKGWTGFYTIKTNNNETHQEQTANAAANLIKKYNTKSEQ